MKTGRTCRTDLTTKTLPVHRFKLCAVGVASTATVLLGSCEGVQSVLDPRGHDAERILTISWVLFGGATAVFFFVMGLTIFVLVRPARRDWLGSNRLIVAGGLIFPIVTLTALLIYSLETAGDMLSPAEDALEIEVVGNQWWWEVRYLDRNGDVVFITANEIRIPAGRPVTARLAATDVIHSFWVPNLTGKIDMIPGHVHQLPFQAKAPGTFRGQCAEYCGGPHAWMAFHVVAEEPEQFARWFEGQIEPAREPLIPSLQQGSELFIASGCGACHTIRGTPADGKLGPDLTHVGSRLTIGAGMLKNNSDTLAQWIAESQRLKPNNKMPSFDVFDADDLKALAAYLESLK